MTAEKLIEYAQDKVFKSESGSDKDGNSPALHFDQNKRLTYASGREIRKFKQMKSLVIRNSKGEELSDEQKLDLFNETQKEDFEPEDLEKKGLIATKQDKIKAFTEDAEPRIKEIKTEIKNHKDSKINKINFENLPADIQYVIFDNKYTTGKISGFPKMMGHVNSYQNAKTDAERQEARQNIAYESFTVSGGNRNEERNKSRIYAALGIDRKDDPGDKIYNKAYGYHTVDKSYPGLVRPDLNEMASKLNITKSNQQPVEKNIVDEFIDALKNVVTDNGLKEALKDEKLTSNKSLFNEVKKHKPSEDDILLGTMPEYMTKEQFKRAMYKKSGLKGNNPLRQKFEKQTDSFTKYHYPGYVEYDATGKAKQTESKTIPKTETAPKAKDGDSIYKFGRKIGAGLQIAANKTGNEKRVIKSYQDAINEDKYAPSPRLKRDGIYGPRTASATHQISQHRTSRQLMQNTAKNYEKSYGESDIPGNISRPEPKPTQPSHGYASHSQKQMEKSRSKPEQEKSQMPGNLSRGNPNSGRSSSSGGFFGGLFG